MLVLETAMSALQIVAGMEMFWLDRATLEHADFCKFITIISNHTYKYNGSWIEVLND